MDDLEWNLFFKHFPEHAPNLNTNPNPTPKPTKFFNNKQPDLHDQDLMPCRKHTKDQSTRPYKPYERKTKRIFSSKTGNFYSDSLLCQTPSLPTLPSLQPPTQQGEEIVVQNLPTITQAFDQLKANVSERIRKNEKTFDLVKEGLVSEVGIKIIYLKFDVVEKHLNTLCTYKSVPPDRGITKEQFKSMYHSTAMFYKIIMSTILESPKLNEFISKFGRGSHQPRFRYLIFHYDEFIGSSLEHWKMIQDNYY